MDIASAGIDLGKTAFHLVALNHHIARSLFARSSRAKNRSRTVSL
jgi:hypothetical protein